MILEEKHVVLKNGADCVLRTPDKEDSEAMLVHWKQTTGETDFMIRYPEEITVTIEEEEKFLENYRMDPRSLMISAAVGGKIVASASLCCVMDVFKYRHRAELGISVQRKYWNMGIGKILILHLIEWARSAGYEQMELEVDSGNDQAIRLYRKLGFTTYGTRERSTRYKGGTYSADHLMVLNLS